MRSLQHILVVIEPRQLRQPALERALAIAQIAGRERVKILALMPVFETAWDLSSLVDTEEKEEARKAIMAKHQKWLDGFLRINAMDYSVESCVIWTKEIGKEITARARESCADVIIKTGDAHGFLDSVLFTPLDWQLLRHAPVPVVIAKDHLWQPTGVIAVAIDLSDPEDVDLRRLNIRLLREAQELAFITRCEIHLVNAIPPVLPPATIDLPGFTPDLISEEAVKEACRNVLSFAARHRIPPEHCHIREGQPDQVIPALCQSLNPTMLFIGTSARKGLAVALVGNICERVADSLDCDVAVITPKAVAERIPYVVEEKR
ncbi:MAG TPA: universal stress protein UspE [Candidatus Avisuccinivibrio pullicola]|nr:universal stress protein UspE [Candidatus Avisuccinivibrio pullicola]